MIYFNAVLVSSKSTKTYAILAIIPLMLIGFGRNIFATPQPTSYSVDAIDDALKPYVTINEKHKAKIDISKAKANGVSKADIIIGLSYIKMQNKMIQDIHEDPTKKSKISNEAKEKFFEKIRYQGLKDRTIKVSFLESVIPLAYAAHLCNYDGPHNQPAVTGSYTNRTAAINALSSGYSQVPFHASQNYPNDYHDWIVAYGCADGVFRYQIIVFDAGSDWRYSNHHSPGEPNPDVLAYEWPVCGGEVM